MVGDFILVNKFAYGIRLPIVKKKVVDDRRAAARRRGRVPLPGRIRRRTTSSAWSGVGGDVVSYQDKQLTVNGAAGAAGARRHLQLRRELRFETAEQFIEKLAAAAAATRTRSIDPAGGAGRSAEVRPFPGRDNCEYNDDGFTLHGARGHYFMMGDNRDKSNDSRYWGFVPDDHIRGRAFFIWFNWDDISSLGVQAGRQRHPVSGASRGWQ